jgi:(E)-4-hydroxy-3-methylbut-2-enyl-diphosphate synthase
MAILRLGWLSQQWEFLRVFNEEQFNDIVISMKASNPIVMIHAVRLLVKTMEDEGMDYPLHLGVTEAGNETEGRVKSAIGIGALLADGIGDTIRVSLTESPAKEIPVAKLIVNTFKADLLSEFKAPNIPVPSSYDPYSYKRRKTSEIDIIGSENVPVVISDLSKELNNHALLKCGFEYKEDDKRFHPGENSSDFIYIGENNKNETISEDIRIIQSENIINATEFTINQDFSKIRFIQFNSGDVIDFDFKLLKDLKDMVIIADITQSKSPVHEARILFFSLMNFNLDFPVLIKVDVDMITEKEVIEISANVGSLFIDGFGEGVWISSKDNIREACELSFSILQACRTRITKTDYISCPSCGRTLFNLEETTAKIKEKTAHLKGVKIGIMGCIVNGPGEMADADFGYVGTGKGKVTLYKKQEVVKRNIPEEDALDELLKLIEQYY